MSSSSYTMNFSPAEKAAGGDRAGGGGGSARQPGRGAGQAAKGGASDEDGHRRPGHHHPGEQPHQAVQETGESPLPHGARRANSFADSNLYKSYIDILAFLQNLCER
jgi:hypothetical protein